LDHSNVVHVHGTGVEEQVPYYAMEFVEGETLAEILARTKDEGDEAETPFGQRGELAFYSNLASAFADVADGLQHAHSRGIVHRDIKPSNLILDAEADRGLSRPVKEGSPAKRLLRILDFGLAHLEGQESLTLSGAVLGTPAYMSPEQARRKRIPVDHRTDVYSLGATLYEALTGGPPFQGKDHADTLSQIIERDPVEPRTVNPRVPKDLGTIVLKCLRKDADDRYGTAEALGQDLRRFVRGDAVEARPESPWERYRRRVVRNRWRFLGAGIVLVVAIAFAVLGYQLSVESQRNRTREYDRLVMVNAMKVLRGETTIPVGPQAVTSGLLGLFFPLRLLGLVEASGRSTVEEAVKELRLAVQMCPERVEGHYYYARGLRLLGKHGEAIAELQAALGCDRGFLPADVWKREIAGEDPPVPPGESSWTRFWLAAHLATAKKQWQEAIDAYDALIRLDEDLEERGEGLYLGSLVEHLLARGLARLELGHFEWAQRDFQ
jgi:tetratricopeptide (TPR) repeat protein